MKTMTTTTVLAALSVGAVAEWTTPPPPDPWAGCPRPCPPEGRVIFNFNLDCLSTPDGVTQRCTRGLTNPVVAGPLGPAIFHSPGTDPDGTEVCQLGVIGQRRNAAGNIVTSQTQNGFSVPDGNLANIFNSNCGVTPACTQGPPGTWSPGSFTGTGPAREQCTGDNPIDSDLFSPMCCQSLIIQELQFVDTDGDDVPDTSVLDYSDPDDNGAGGLFTLNFMDCGDTVDFCSFKTIDHSPSKTITESDGTTTIETIVETPFTFDLLDAAGDTVIDLDSTTLGNFGVDVPTALDYWTVPKLLYGDGTLPPPSDETDFGIKTMLLESVESFAVDDIAICVAPKLQGCNCNRWKNRVNADAQVISDCEVDVNAQLRFLLDPVQGTPRAKFPNGVDQGGDRVTLKKCLNKDYDNPQPRNFVKNYMKELCAAYLNAFCDQVHYFFTPEEVIARHDAVMALSSGTTTNGNGDPIGAFRTAINFDRNLYKDYNRDLDLECPI